MADVIAVFFVERVVGDEFKGLPPEDQAILHSQAKALEKERVLKAAKVFQMTVFPQRHVEITHTEWEMLRQMIDRGGTDWGARKRGIGVCERRIRCGEVLGQVIEDRAQTVVLIQARKCPSGELLESTTQVSRSM